MYFFRVIHKLLVIYWLLYFILKNLLIELILSLIIIDFLKCYLFIFNQIQWFKQRFIIKNQ